MVKRSLSLRKALRAAFNRKRRPALTRMFHRAGRERVNELHRINGEIDLAHEEQMAIIERQVGTMRSRAPEAWRQAQSDTWAAMRTWKWWAAVAIVSVALAILI